jgi:heme o synthase
MKTVADTLPSAVRSQTCASDLSELTKLRLTFMVLITSAAGFYMGSFGPFQSALLFHTLLGTALVAASASALNQIIESDIDQKMRRTQHRPLPSGRLHPDQALLFAVACALAGLFYLGWMVNPLSGLLAAMTLALYVFVYTPLKRKTTLNTLVGAIPGAIPPVIGWVSARGQLDNGAVILFLILSFWQLPHFLAIAWMYREDYARADLKMLSVLDPSGRSSGRQAFLYALGLIPISLLPFFFNLAGPWYFLTALLCGLGFAFQSWKFQHALDLTSARRLFFVSIFYLPLILIAMMLDKNSL